MVLDDELVVGNAVYDGAVYAAGRVVLASREPARFGGHLAVHSPPRFASPAATLSQFVAGVDLTPQTKRRLLLPPLPDQLGKVSPNGFSVSGDALFVRVEGALDLRLEERALVLGGPVEARIPFDGALRLYVDGEVRVSGRIRWPLLLRATGAVRVVDDLWYVDGAGRRPVRLDPYPARQKEYRGDAALVIVAPEVLLCPRPLKRDMVVCALLFAYKGTVRVEATHLGERLLIYGARIVRKRPYRRRKMLVRRGGETVRMECGFRRAYYFCDRMVEKRLPAGVPAVSVPVFSGFRVVRKKP